MSNKINQHVVMHKEAFFTKKITLQTILVLLLASGFYFYEFIVQTAPVAIVQHLMHDFAIDATQVGFISGCFYYAYTPMQLTTGLLLDRYSTRAILTVVSAVCALGTLLFAYAPNIYWASLARFLIGGASASAFIGVLHLALRWVPPAYFALFAGMAEMMGAIGGGMGTKPFAILLTTYNWRAIFLGLACIGFVLSLLIFFFVKNQPANLKKTNPISHDKGFLVDNLKTVLQQPATWLIGSYSFLIWAPILGFASLWGASFVRQGCGVDNVTATGAILYIWLGVAITSPCIGWLSDFFARRCIFMTICALAGTISMTLIIFTTNLPPFLLNTLMFTLGFASAGQTLAFALIKDIHIPSTSGTANGFNNMCVVAGGLILPIIMGKILDLNWQGFTHEGIRMYSLESYRIAMCLLPGCYFLAAIASIFGIKETFCRHIWEK